MTNTTQLLSPPSPRLLRLLPTMAEERGVSFTRPDNQAEAIAEFQRLKKVPKESREIRDRDIDAVRSAMRQSGGSSRYRPAEVTGFGSAASWSEPEEEESLDTGPCERCGGQTSTRWRIGGVPRWRCSHSADCARRRKARR